MSTSAHRGWLIATLALAVILLVGSIGAVVATTVGQGSTGDSGSRSSTSRTWHSGRTDSGMMSGYERSTDRTSGRTGCLELMRGWEES